MNAFRHCMQYVKLQNERESLNLVWGGRAGLVFISLLILLFEILMQEIRNWLQLV